jgi:hypothetical protein
LWRWISSSRTPCRALSTTRPCFRPREYVIEVLHAFYSFRHIIIQSWEQLIIPKLWVINMLLLERCLRRLKTKHAN